MELMEKNVQGSKGFKQSDIGMIPSDWEVSSVQVLTSKVGDGLHSTPLSNSSALKVGYTSQYLARSSISLLGMPPLR